MGKPSSASSNSLKGTRSGETLRVTERTDQNWTVDGGGGNDALWGGSGSDTLLGGSGDDIVFGLPNDAKLDGGVGFDTLDLSLATGITRYLASFGGQLTYWPDNTPTTYAIASGFERVIGSAYADGIFGGSQSETLVGGGGADHIEGGAGDDTLVGGYLALSHYNPLGRTSLPNDDAGDFFEFTHSSSGSDRILDFQLGQDHLFFYGVPQPDQSQIRPQGADLIVPWENGTVTLVGLGNLAPSSYKDLFTLTNGDISVLG